MRGLAVAALVVMLMAVPASALGYGTSTAYVTGLTGTPPGTWAGLANAQSAADGGAAATLTETDPGGTPVPQPSERSFAGGAGGWSSAVSSVLLVCTAGAGWDGGTGTPAGSLGTTFLTLVVYAGTTCGSTWTSPDFAWSGGPPASASFSLARRVDANGLLGQVSLRWTARLVDVTAGTSRTMATAVETADTAWGTVTGTADPSWFVTGHTYRIELVTGLELAPILLSTVGVNYDDVVLTLVPPAYAAEGEVRIASVPPGTTHTLELRGAAAGEDFTLEVWNGGAWDPLGTLTAGAGMTTLTTGLTTGQWNGGTVRVRARDAGGDAAASTMSLDWARVVSTGGVTLTGPATVVLDPVTLTGLGTVQSTTTVGPFQVADAGGAASGWDLSVTLDGLAAPGGATLPASAVSVAPAAPATPDASDMTGVSAGAGGALDPVTPRVLMRAAPGAGIGTYRQSPDVTIRVPANGSSGTYTGTLTVTVS